VHNTGVPVAEGADDAMEPGVTVIEQVAPGASVGPQVEDDSVVPDGRFGAETDRLVAVIVGELFMMTTVRGVPVRAELLATSFTDSFRTRSRSAARDGRTR
jgi:hypothetical protein